MRCARRSPTPSQRAAAACATGAMPTAVSATSSNAISCTTVPMQAAAPAGARYAASGRDSGRPITARAASAADGRSFPDGLRLEGLLPVAFAALARQAQVLRVQSFSALDVGRVERNAVDRTNLAALRLVMMPDAFGTARRVDLVDLLALRYRLVRAFGLADVAIDAFV